MLGRVVVQSIRHRPGGFVLTVIAVAVGAALAASLLGVGLGVTERMAAELRGFGANIAVAAGENDAYLDERHVGRLKGIFWAHNIVALAPFLSKTVTVRGEPTLLVGTWFDRVVPGAALPGPAPKQYGQRSTAPLPDRWRTGLARLATAWRVDGQWPADGSGAALVGRAVAARLGLRVGDRIEAQAAGRSASFPIAGIVTTGGPEDDQVLVDLERVQTLLDLPRKIEGLRVSALVTPDNALAERARRTGPERLPPAEYEKWYCTPYVDSIVFQIQEALPGTRARAIREITDTEGRFLTSVALTFSLVAAVGVAASVVGVVSAVMRTALERRGEIGIMKAIGAERGQIASVFLLEAAGAGIAGGGLGGLVGVALTRVIGLTVFRVPIDPHPLLLAIVIPIAVALALAGTAGPLVHALRVPAAMTLAER